MPSNVIKSYDHNLGIRATVDSLITHTLWWTAQAMSYEGLCVMRESTVTIVVSRSDGAFDSCNLK